MSVSIVVARSLVAEFERRELDASALLERSELSRERLQSGPPLLELVEAERLTRAAVELSGDEGICHSAGMHTPATALQIVSLLLLSAADLRGAGRVFEQHSRLVSMGPTYALIEEGELARWTLRPAIQPSDHTRLMVDYGLAFCLRIASALTGIARNEGALLEVHFQHAEPAYAQRYRDTYRCPISFEREVNALVFQRSLLDRRLPHGDPIVSEAVRAPAQQLLRASDREGRWTDRVQFVLEHARDLSSVDVASMAQRLAVNERALHRRLAREGTSISTLIDAHRRDRALQQLRESRVPIAELALQLGFSSASAFGRAFRSWTGGTPSAYRRSQRAEPQDIE